jgi:hypothetical protein
MHSPASRAEGGWRAARNWPSHTGVTAGRRERSTSRTALVGFNRSRGLGLALDSLATGRERWLVVDLLTPSRQEPFPPSRVRDAEPPGKYWCEQPIPTTIPGYPSLARHRPLASGIRNPERYAAISVAMPATGSPRIGPLRPLNRLYRMTESSNPPRKHVMVLLFTDTSGPRPDRRVAPGARADNWRGTLPRPAAQPRRRKRPDRWASPEKAARP